MSLKSAKIAKKPKIPVRIDSLPTRQTTVRPKQNVLLLENEVGYSNLTMLDSLDEDTFVQNLKVRFMNKQIYVRKRGWYWFKRDHKKNWPDHFVDLHRIDCDIHKSLWVTAIIFNRSDRRIRTPQYPGTATTHVCICVQWWYAMLTCSETVTDTRCASMCSTVSRNETLTSASSPPEVCSRLWSDYFNLLRKKKFVFKIN